MLPTILLFVCQNTPCDFVINSVDDCSYNLFSVAEIFIYNYLKETSKPANWQLINW